MVMHMVSYKSSKGYKINMKGVNKNKRKCEIKY